VAKKERRVAVTERAIVQRINRKFVNEDGRPARELKKTRGARAVLDLGDYYVLNTRYNLVANGDRFVDVEELARKMGVLADWEYLEGGK
jgi:hypothetical protein